MTIPENRPEDLLKKRALIEKILQQKKALARESLDVQVRPAHIPLSFAQERLWYVEQSGTAGGAYNISGGIRFEGSLDIDVLSAALGAIVERHEALRTRFPAYGDTGEQVIDAPAAVVLTPMEIDEANLKTEMGALAGEPFDLAGDRLYRFNLFRIAGDIHVLSIVMNHIVADGWSVGVLAREIGSLYSAFVAGQPSPLAPLPLQYADYAIWQRRLFSVDGFRHDLDYWRETLADVAPVLDLPTDRPRSALPGSNGARVGVLVPAELVGALTELGRREGATLYMVLLSALQIVLGRWSGQRDVVVGSTIAGRDNAKVEPLIGFFLNTVALRTNLSGNPGFRELLAQVRNTTLNAYAHQTIPFDRMIAEVQPPRDPSRHPLFQVMFVLRNLPARSMTIEGLRIRPVSDNRSTTKMDLSLNLKQSNEQLYGELEYATDLFDESTAQRLIAHWLNLLQAVVADADCRIDALPLMSPDERATILDDWRRNTAGGDIAEPLLHRMFESWAARTPESIAVIDGTLRLSYQELNRRANRLAKTLADAGVTPETVVGVRIARSATLLVAILALFKAGGVYLPLDPSLPAERVDHMLDEAGARLILTSGAPDDAAFGERRPTLHVDAGSVPDARFDDWAGPAIEAANLAYVIFTSGSTGKPKGVMATHRGIVNYLHFLRSHYALNAQDRVLNVSGIGFDPSMRDYFGPLTSGAAVVIVDNTGELDATRYWRAICEHRVTRLLSTTPSFLRLLCHAAQAAPAEHGLSDVLTCGEALDRSVVERALAVLGDGVRIVNQYGPSECSMASTSYVADVKEHHVAIGRPLPNVNVYVLDEHMNPVPAGVTGELYVGGAGMTRGYVGRPDLTAERFVPDPFARGERVYRTGDHVRWDAHGQLHYIGRTDFQVKVRGTRIEFHEIIAVLNALPEVEQSALAVHGEGENQRLVAYVVARGPGLTADRLVEQLKTTLPNALIPNAFVALDAIPLTPNGKLDRRALPSYETSLLRNSLIAPESTTEQIVSDIFALLLGLREVGRDDNFFLLGGHSLLANRMLARIEDAFDVRPALRKLFEKPTVAAIAAEVDALVAEQFAMQEADGNALDEVVD